MRSCSGNVKTWSCQGAFPIQRLFAREYRGGLYNATHRSVMHRLHTDRYSCSPWCWTLSLAATVCLQRDHAVWYFWPKLSIWPIHHYLTSLEFWHLILWVYGTIDHQQAGWLYSLILLSCLSLCLIPPCLFHWWFHPGPNSVVYSLTSIEVGNFSTDLHLVLPPTHLRSIHTSLGQLLSAALYFTNRLILDLLACLSLACP